MRRFKANARALKSRAAVQKAFAILISRHRYEELDIADIITLANVSRSTFYAHYAGKDGLLVASISGPFAVLADTIQPVFVEAHLVRLLEHFWLNRGVARGILIGPTRRKAAEVLIGLIEDRLRSAGGHRRGALVLPLRLAAIQLAEILLAPVAAWLLGESRCTPAALAAGLRTVSVAAVKSMTA